MNSYQEKFNNATNSAIFYKLTKKEQKFIEEKSIEYQFTFSQIKQIIEIAKDLETWNEGSIIDIFPLHSDKKVLFKKLIQTYTMIKESPKSYKNFELKNIPNEQKFTFKTENKDSFGLGLCPVASEKTRCCNLLTLDAVESCGFDCSYCSIQSFYNQNTITFDSTFATKLKNLNLDKNRTYHIGTGQSSDSLLWGNREGVMDALFEFAKENENVILEFKTKSDNINYILENEVPKNIICTWSLNTPTIIDNEEHLTAKLEKRVAAARAVANKGVKVGFHFHPIVEYENYLDEYKSVYEQLLNTFKSSEVALVSFGTLTFIKPVIKQLRERGFRSKITQMPFVDANKKESYPHKTKVAMFKHAYESFALWHKDLFFYLCMEDHEMWKDAFGYQYATNNDFERAMISSYTQKLGMEFLI